MTYFNLGEVRLNFNPDLEAPIICNTRCPEIEPIRVPIAKPLTVLSGVDELIQPNKIIEEL